MERETLISSSPPTSPRSPPLPSRTLDEDLSDSLLDSIADDPDPEAETADYLPAVDSYPLRPSYSSWGSYSGSAAHWSTGEDTDNRQNHCPQWSGVSVDNSAKLSLLPVSLDTKPSPAPSLLFWNLEDEKPISVGAGLSNLGNTCFLNSVLQCLTHTVGLVQALSLYANHLPCEPNDAQFCMLCSLREHVERSLTLTGSVFHPYKFVDNLSYISSCFQRYQQEDAHEFLQCFLDRLDTSCNTLVTKGADLSSRDDNLVKHIFGGRLVSKLRCCNCNHSSDTYEPSIDLSLEIEDVDSLLNALESFTRVEKIEDIETKFTCEKCKEEVSVEKQLMLEQAPMVSALHLKRFKNYGSYVEKIDKHLEFPLELDLEPYTSSNHNNDLKYDLYAVIVHTAFTSTCGHYYCFIRSAPDTWYKFDDSKVIRVPEAYVLSQEAYILFYAKQGTPWFSSFMETYKPSLDTLSNASPKSVLDNVDISISPINVSSNHCGDIPLTNATPNHCSDVNEISEAMDEIPAVPFGGPKHVSSEVTDARVDYNARHTTLKPVTSKSGDGIYHKVETAKVSNDNVTPRTPPRSPSPDIYKEEMSPEVVFSTKRADVKSVDRMSCKRQLNNDLDDPKLKEAWKQCKQMPGNRREALLLAARGGSKSEGSMNKKSKKRVLSNSEDYSHSGNRNKPNHNRPSRSLATASHR